MVDEPGQSDLHRLGGIQEEAPALGKPVLVMRDVTERPEAVEAGNAVLVGTDRRRIVSTVRDVLFDTARYGRMSRGGSPYGDGKAALRIVDALAAWGDVTLSEGSSKSKVSGTSGL